MNSKTLLLLGAVGALAMTSAEAQVYSVNAVGYVNKTLKPGFNLISNPLIVSDNTLAALLPAPEEGTTVYKWTGAAYEVSGFEFGAWSTPGLTLNVGEGAFITNPTAQDKVITFVGDVATGALSTDIPAGFSIRSSKVPQAGALTSVLGFNPPEGTVVYQWDAATQAYVVDGFEFGAWNSNGATGPVVAVADAFWVNSPSNVSWTRNFSVN